MTRKWSKRSKRNLRGIHPDLRRVMDRALAESPLDFIVIEGLRSADRQREMVAKGASQTMKSRHLTGHAVDLLPIGPDGPAFDWPLYHQLAPAVKAAAEAEGVAVDWGGDWQNFKDGPHFELDRSAYPTTEWRTGDPPPKRRTSPAQTGSVQASAVTMASGAGTALSAVSGLDSVAQYIVLVFAGVIVLAGVYILRDRLEAWADGWR